MPFHKAHNLPEIDQAVRFNDAIGPEHAFYTEFSDLRGDKAYWPTSLVSLPP